MALKTRLDTEAINLYYLNARYYDPQVKRFINADNNINTNISLLGFNLFAYCDNNPISYSDYSGEGKVWNWIKDRISKAKKFVEEKVIQPIKNTAINIIDDVINYDRNNTDEQKTYNSHYFSAYKGALVIRIKSDFLTSWSVCNTIFLNHNNDNRSDRAEILNHEYGHYIKEQEIGTAEYLGKVALPSVIYNGLTRVESSWFNSTWMYDNYYNMPWEYNADLNSGIVRPEHKPWAKGIHDLYWGIK